MAKTTKIRAKNSRAYLTEFQVADFSVYEGGLAVAKSFMCEDLKIGDPNMFFISD